MPITRAITLLAAQPTREGTIRVSLAHPTCLQVLEGSPEEMVALARAMDEVSVLAGATEEASGWLAEVPVGHDVVKLGLNAQGRVRLLVVPAHGHVPHQ